MQRFLILDIMENRKNEILWGKTIKEVTRKNEKT